MKSDIMWIYQALLCVLLSVDVECRKQTLQRAFHFDHINKKCHFLPFDRFSEGAKRERKPNYDLYEKKEYVRECIIGSGVNYKGRRSFTKTGITCQSWNMSIPHEHNFKPARHKKFDLRQNFCRNPDNDPSGPWCFTELTETRHQECGLPQCSEDSDNDVEVEVTTSCYRGQGEGYRGTVNVTPAGVTCQRWDALFPHNHSYTPHNYKCKDLRENFCRNPDGSEIPWCFTTDPKVRKAFCTNIPRCESERSDSTECYEDNGESYRGNLSKTRSGIPCGLWSDHTFRRDTQSAKASAGLELNLCRNPDRDKHGPWCYTSNSSIPWDYCGLERCKSVSSDDHQKSTGHEGSLKMVGLPIISNKRCSQSHKGILPITETKICAGGKRDQGVCEKDYGGPLVCQEGESKVIVGVSINGRGCAVARRPAVFVNVAFYSEWIRKVFKYYSDMEISY
ncbi:hepatocyte growth factor-like protein [Labeo rohita]|uniref:Hepatocyte growth factor-like protein n=1 Tax=Labeo rohita TaxID=84645 RepID=A0A498MLG2_LABRO|nr:hepatocyte growth factor-like protein [Labeo rohita]